MSVIKSLLEYVEATENEIEQVFNSTDGKRFELLREGKWVPGRFGHNIRIDQPTHLHGVGQQHATVYGRTKTGKPLVIVNFDGTGSHGTQGRLHSKDAEPLRARGYKIRNDNIVEFVLLDDEPQLLLEG